MDHMPFAAIIFQSIPEAIIVYMMGLALTGIRLKGNIKGLILIGIISSVFSYIIRSLPIPFGLHTLLIIPMAIILMRYLLRISYKQGILVFMLGLIVQLVVEIIYTPIIAVIINKPITEIIKDPFLRIVIPWPYLASMLLLSLYIDKKDLNIFPLLTILKTKFLNIRYLIILVVMIQALLIGLININLLLEDESNVKAYISSNIHLLTLLILISIILALYLSKKLLDLVKKEVETESKLLFLKNVNDLFITIRAQRHDFLNHVHTLNGLLAMKDHSLAKQYVDKLLKETVQLNDVIKLQEPFLAALLRSKLAYADSKGIKLKINTHDSLKSFSINSFELNKIIGNLLDNAIEAVEGYQEEKKKIEISIRQLPYNYVFEIVNTCQIDDAEKINILFENNFTTKEGHSGIGLSIVKELVEKNKGKIIVGYKEGLITFTVTLPK